MTIVPESLLTRIASAYDALPHTPTDTAVVCAYDAFKHELLRQYRAIPYKVVYTATDPYVSSSDMMFLVAATGVLSVYTGSDLPADHPMTEIHRWSHLADGGFEYVSYNSVFRAVHDALVHIPHRLSFGPVGEFRAFQVHAGLICSLCAEGRLSRNSKCGWAIRALATETLAQNAWFNTIGERKSFAPQKACLLPDSLIAEALELMV